MMIVELNDKKSNLICSIAAVLTLLANKEQNGNCTVTEYNKNISDSSKYIAGSMFGLLGEKRYDVLFVLRNSGINSSNLLEGSSILRSTIGGGLGIFDENIRQRSHEEESSKDIEKTIDETFKFSAEIIDNFSKTHEGKKAIFNFAMDHDLELTKIDNNIKRIALLKDQELSERVVWEIMEAVLKYYMEQSYYQHMPMTDKKAIMFALLNLKSLDARKSWHELINVGVKLYQELAYIDSEYFEELSELSLKYIVLRKKIVEIITE